MGTTFIVSIMLIASFIDLPFSIYRNFVIEQKFGFNRMTVKTFIADLIKEILLTLILMIPLIFAILYLMNISSIGDYWWIYVWVIISLFTLTMMWIYPSFIAPIFNKFNPLDNDALKSRIITYWSEQASEVTVYL